jgi:predicted nuclease with TOPRIM domain
MDDSKPTLWEQHAQSITAAITLAILIGAGTLLLSMRDDISSMKTELKFMSEKLNSAGDDRFRGADWRREKSILDERFIGLRSEVQDLRKRVEELERTQAKNHPR